MKRLLIFLTPLLFSCSNKEEKIIYYPNGKIKEKYYLVDKKYDGKGISYYENGNLQMRVTFSEGKLNGKSEYYYPNGKLKLVKNYIDGKALGKYIMYHETGGVKEVGNTDKDSTYGRKVLFDEKRQITEVNFSTKKTIEDVLLFENGVLTKVSFFPKKGMLKEFKVGDTVKLSIFCDRRFFDSLSVKITHTNENKTEKFDTILTTRTSTDDVVFKTIASKRGKFFINTYIKNFMFVKFDSLTIIKTIPTGFESVYTVK